LAIRNHRISPSLRELRTCPKNQKEGILIVAGWGKPPDAKQYKSYHHHRTKKRHTKKLFFATWKVRSSPVQVREAYRKRFGIETSYRQLNQSRARTTSRDPLYRFLLVGLSLFLRNVWQRLVQLTEASNRRARKKERMAASNPPRYQDVLDAFTEFLSQATQSLISSSGAP